MAFHDVRLPEDIERGATGGPKFKTRVFTAESGYEQRNISWTRTRGEWDLSYGIMNIEDTGWAETFINAIRDFFYARFGRAHSFRFKDWADYKIGEFADDASRQLIALGNNTTTAFQLFKRYSSGGFTFDRTIIKPISGTAKAFMDVTALTEVGSSPAAGQFSIDYNTGILTTGDVFASTGGTGPGGEEVLSVITEFDVPVRFDVDQLQVSVELWDAGAIPALPVVEVRVD
jgi:uncharacterized protein (TIGR02217 family)